MIISETDMMRTVQLGPQFFQTRFETNWRLLMAASTIISIPTIVVFVGAQKYFVKGIALTGLK